MKSQLNMTLIILIICLISFIMGIEQLDILSFSIANNSKISGGEIKVNQPQLPIKYKDNVEIIWDVSKSIQNKENINKITTSKNVLYSIVNRLPTNLNLGIRVFGNKDRNNTPSFFTIPLGVKNRKEIINFINKINPTGESSIRTSLLKAKQNLIKYKGSKHIILVTDGEDTGKIMPSKVIKKLTKFKIKTHIVHIGKIDKVSQLKLKSLANLGNGKYFTYFEKNKISPTINLK
ncbi:uncharacterized protein containing a von Willebrand factor type A (vWA) domain [Halobacteroides halobius DSM 5150]|uniref:Uncharacterized protein containing a von Willebrand factor type A (VWA) domain n=1 Tax=Halobacteroides halobius (strain ATCC 35273 / DSM 5150 / MD-1) TaxID=748449 RepID=L0KB80_HALHC|nr:vWA domain-containing protein [Halobacteroides halobius]AGB41323.1 uncharacterized protein containing a von Willebrand factor type A (vWA) domain [Halobacteroides halobius DSM 5150]